MENKQREFNHFCFEGHIEKVRQLLSHSNLDGEDEYFIRPIESAINGQSLEVLEYLLANGTNVNVWLRRYKPTITPLHLVVDNACEAMIQEYHFDILPIHKEIIRLLLKYGADYTLKTDNGYSPVDVSLNVNEVKQELEKMISENSPLK